MKERASGIDLNFKNLAIRSFGPFKKLDSHANLAPIIYYIFENIFFDKKVVISFLHMRLSKYRLEGFEQNRSFF